MVRKRIGLACALTLVLGLTACGGDDGGDTGDATTAPTATASGELVIWADDKRAAALEPFAEQFGTDNGVTVRVEAISEELQTQFVTASQAGKAPDIVVGAHDWIGNLVRNGTIDPVQLADPSAYDEVAIRAVTFNGQVYGVPYAVENIALIRNTDLAPEAPATMEDMVASGEKLVADKKTKEIMALQVGQNGDPYHLMPVYASGGGSIFGTTAAGDADPKNVTVDSAESVAAMKLVAGIGEKGSGALKRSIGAENSISLFTGKNTAYLVSGPWAITDIEKAGIKYDITPVPKWESGGTAAPFIGVQAFYVASKGANKTLAQEFATNFVGTPELQVALYEAEPRRPALLTALEQVSAEDPDVEKFKAAGDEGSILPAIPEMAAVWDPLGKAQAAIVGGAAVESTMKSAADAIRQAIG